MEKHIQQLAQIARTKDSLDAMSSGIQDLLLHGETASIASSNTTITVSHDDDHDVTKDEQGAHRIEATAKHTFDAREDEEEDKDLETDRDEEDENDGMENAAAAAATGSDEAVVVVYTKHVAMEAYATAAFDTGQARADVMTESFRTALASSYHKARKST
jgi:hypothetical protein